MESLRHLTKRFVLSLWPGGPSPAGEAWVAGVLSEAEQVLWRRMSGPDRRHAVAVARRVERALGPAATRPALAAALLHDVGKVESGLGTCARAVATVARMAGRPRLTPRIALYARHGELGAGLLERAGSHPLTVTWAREHHLPPARWTLPDDLAQVLKAADDD